MQRPYAVFAALLFLASTVPSVARGSESAGNGYVLQSQFNFAPGLVSGNGFSSYGGVFRVMGPVLTTPPGDPGAVGSSQSSPAPENQPPDTATFAELIATLPPGTAPRTADIIPDSRVDVLDFNLLMVRWGEAAVNSTSRRCAGKTPGDINCDGEVGLLDFNLLMVYWGKPVNR